MSAPMNDRLLDPEVVDRFLCGHDPGRVLSIAEQIEVVRRCDARGYSTNTIAKWVLGCRTTKVKQLRTGKGIAK